MNVTKDDYTFATTTTADGPQPYGVSEYCGYHDGANYYEWSEFNINLTGTGFRIQDSVRVQIRLFPTTILVPALLAFGSVQVQRSCTLAVVQICPA